MNMKRIVFVAVGILIMLAIMGYTLHSMSHIDEINEKRREQQKGEALASRLVTTAVTTSIWDSLRTTETAAENPGNPGNPENYGNPENPENYGNPENPENPGLPEPENGASGQTMTEVVMMDE